MSHETIYRSLFVQARGVLKKELLSHLRSKRSMRRSKPVDPNGDKRGHIKDIVSIRLAELLCRASGRRSGAWKHITTTPAPQCRAVRRSQSAACSRRFPTPQAEANCSYRNRQLAS